MQTFVQRKREIDGLMTLPDWWLDKESSEQMGGIDVVMMFPEQVGTLSRATRVPRSAWSTLPFCHEYLRLSQASR